MVASDLEGLDITTAASPAAPNLTSNPPTLKSEEPDKARLTKESLSGKAGLLRSRR